VSADLNLPEKPGRSGAYAQSEALRAAGFGPIRDILETNIYAAFDGEKGRK
jgi:hypothetical protein